MLIRPDTIYQTKEGTLSGSDIIKSEKRVKELKGVFENEAVRNTMDQEAVIYRVEMHAKEKEGIEGGLFFGTSYVNPGVVGDEYFMTKGHFHAKTDRAEYYWCIKGEGVLILMDREGECRGETMVPGSLHYIPGYVAHRIANTGNETLVVGACWPSDAGHDYQTIMDKGFTARLKRIDGKPRLVKADR